MNKQALYDYILGFNNTLKATPFEWIDIVAALDFMVTSYFHGTCFSLLGNTPFYSIDISSIDGEHSKIRNLLEQVELLDRFSMGTDDACVSRIVNTYNEAVSKGNISFEKEVNLLRQKGLKFQQYIYEMIQWHK